MKGAPLSKASDIYLAENYSSSFVRFFFSEACEIVGDKFVPMPQFHTQSKSWVDNSEF